PMVIGGGTYAKGIHNTIAFGAEFPDDPDIHMHGDDEYIPIKNLARQTEIYVHALLNLLDL
ncbi:MAG: dipeptidase, partial [Erysipelotrichales bacterium]|nr:dipeptidase [Erysipelotrichales bacterium]